MDQKTVFTGINDMAQDNQVQLPQNPNESLPELSSKEVNQQPFQPPPISPPRNFVNSREGSGESFFSSKIFKALLGLIFLIIVFAILYIFVLPRFQSKEPKNATLTYWGLWEDQRIMGSIISEFEKQNPNIKIEYSKQDIKGYRKKIDTRIANGTGPDIFKFHNTWYPMLSKYLIPFPEDVISKQDFKNYFYPVIQHDLIQNGGIYGIPLGIDTLSLYINVDAFNAASISPPTGWPEFIEASKALTVKEESGKIKTAGAALGTYANINHAPDIISLLFAQKGVTAENLSSKKEAAQDALDFYTSFSKNEKTWDDTLDNSQLAFAKGNLAMYFGYSWDFFAIKAMNPSLNFKILPVPSLLNRSTTIASYWAEGVSAKSKNQQEALLFIKFLARKETVQKLFTETSKTRSFGVPYARVDLVDSLRENDNIYPFAFQAKNAESS
ncbi:extracellular solute-binding protein, partial [Patescibacteria group bacterium]|nr:extracellular solute-binding protein [Patescibacteria group bacterium]